MLTDLHDALIAFGGAGDAASKTLAAVAIRDAMSDMERELGRQRDEFERNVRRAGGLPVAGEEEVSG